MEAELAPNTSKIPILNEARILFQNLKDIDTMPRGVCSNSLKKVAGTT